MKKFATIKSLPTIRVQLGKLLIFLALASTALFQWPLFDLGNATTLYFIVQYHVIIDSTMISNIFHKNLKEAAELAHPNAPSASTLKLILKHPTKPQGQSS